MWDAYFLCHIRLPSPEARQRIRRSALVVSPLVTKRRSFQNTGEEWPLPGSVVFQRTSPSAQRMGTLVAALIPAPSKPRNRGQESWAHMEIGAVSARIESRGKTRVSGVKRSQFNTEHN